jgi:TonB family protein
LDRIDRESQQMQAELLRHEVVVAINAQEAPYGPYLQRIRDQIRHAWRYPDELKRQTGVLHLAVQFTIENNGVLSGVELLRPSGVALLDTMVTTALQQSSPFLPLPEAWRLERLHVLATFEYTSRAGIRGF